MKRKRLKLKDRDTDESTHPRLPAVEVGGTKRGLRRERKRRKREEQEAKRELFIVTGKSKLGIIRRVYPTRKEAEADAEQVRRKRKAQVEVRSSLE